MPKPSSRVDKSQVLPPPPISISQQDPYQSLREGADFLRSHKPKKSPRAFFYEGKYYDLDNLSDTDREELKHLFP